MKTISDATIPKGTLNQSLYVSTKDAFTKIAAFTGGLLFVAIFLSVIYLTLFLIADYQDFTILPWATLRGVEIRNSKECEQAVKFHGSEARLRNWDDERKAWVFPREQNGKIIWCKVFAYTVKQEKQ